MCRAAFLLAAVSVATAAAPPAREPAAWVRLVEQLASEDLAARRRAAAGLEALGEDALPLLRRAAKHDDPDVRLRAIVVMAAIHRRGIPEERTFTGHTDGVFRLAVSPDGKRVVSGSWFRNTEPIARVWDLFTGKELFSLRTSRFGVHCADWSPDGRRILTGGGDFTVRLWDAANGRELARLKAGTSVAAVRFLPGGSRAVGCDTDGVITAWELGKEAKVWSRKVHEGRIYGLAVTPDGRHVLTGGHDSAVLLLDAATGKEVRGFKGHSREVHGAAISPTGKVAATGGHDRTIRLWDLASGLEVRRLEGHREAVYSVAFSRDGGRLVSGGCDRTARVWDVATAKELRRLDGHSDWVTCAAFLPCGRFVATGSFDKTLRLWDVR